MRNCLPVKYGAVLVLATLVCSLPAFGNRPLYQDDFSQAGGWGTSTDADSSVEYDGGGLRMQVFTGNYIVWSNPKTDSFANVHVEVTVKNNESDPFAAFAIICDLQSSDESFYYLAITPDGHYAIAKKPSGGKSEYLTVNATWETSDKIVQNADTYRLGADCGYGSLTLYADGKKIDTVKDSTYVSGMTGLLLWSAEKVQHVDATFDDFIVRKLK